MDPDEISKMFESWDLPASQSTITNGSYVRYNNKDLSSISTRDLLNECYRRRAIEKFNGSISIDQYMLEHQPDIKGYALRDLSREVWESVTSNSKFYDDAMSIKVSNVTSYMRTDFTGEIYICKHPTKVRR